MLYALVLLYGVSGCLAPLARASATCGLGIPSVLHAASSGSLSGSAASLAWVSGPCCFFDADARRAASDALGNATPIK